MPPGRTFRETVCDAVSGNLCRCTGYRPIVDAASDALGRGLDDIFDQRTSETIAALKTLDVSEELAIERFGRRYLAPTSLHSLATACEKNPDALLIAGSTDVGLWVTKQHRDLDMIIDVTRVPELERIEEVEDVLKIGAGCTYQQVHRVIRDRWADFRELIRRIGGAQVRAAGTIGGNIANGSPIGDTMPALIALGSNIALLKGKTRRTLPLEDFYLGYRKTALQAGEFIAAIHIPKSTIDPRCYKFSKRFDQDISAVLGAFALELSPDRTVKKIRIAFGGMAAVPKRTIETERVLLGKSWNETTIAAGKAALAAEFDPISDMRASANYRLTVAQNLLRKALIESADLKTATRIMS